MQRTVARKSLIKSVARWYQNKVGGELKPYGECCSARAFERVTNARMEVVLLAAVPIALLAAARLQRI